jgi:DNA-binding transcriptional MerR regulator
MRIGILEAKSGMSRDTIRYYEARGLLGKVEKHNAYKAYTARTLRRLELIKTAKSIGFTLSEIGDVMDAWEGDNLNVASKTQLLTQKLVEIRSKFEDLSRLKSALEEILAKVEHDCDDSEAEVEISTPRALERV